jgi:hypothetical protein
MFTPGSKYFLGLTGLSLVVAVLYVALVNPSDLGAIALLGLAISGAMISGFSLFTRDGDAFSVAEAAEANAVSPAPTFWPIVFAFGSALVLLGLATNSTVFVLGIAVLVGGGIEWTIQDWADSSSSDRELNNFVRERAISAIEYPGLAAVGLGIIAFLFSRVILAASKEAGPVIFIVVATLILIGGVTVATKPALSGKRLVSVLVLASVVLLAAGVTSALMGERNELVVAARENHYDASNRECGAEASEHYDHLANNAVAMKSAIAATITVEDGALYAQEIGLTKKLDTVTFSRATALTVLFRNLDAEEHRLLVNLGSAKVGTTDVMEKVGTCTQLTGKGQTQAMTLKIDTHATAAEPYSFTVPGIKGEIKLVVP